MIADRANGALTVISECRYGRMMYLKNDRYIGRAFDLYGEYSEAEVILFRQLLQPNAIVIDAGANIGAHTVALASLVPQGTVLAFEPFRYLYHLLCGNVALNGLTNVIPSCTALGAASGTIVVPALDYTRDDNYGGLALGTIPTGNTVRQVALDDILPHVDFIKADVEGMEQSLLQGAKRLIAECRPVLYVENNPGPDQQALIDYIHSLDYDLWWHHAPHYNPDNFRHNTEDIYGNVVSFNMLGLPSSPDNNVAGLPMIPRHTPPQTA